MNSQLPLFALQDRQDTWTVRTSRRARRLSVRVYPGGRVEIVAPLGASPSVVQRFIGEHRRWIDDRVRDFASMATLDTELPTELHLAGIERRFTIEYQMGRGRARVQPLDQVRLLICGNTSNRHAVAKALRAWLIDMATQELAKQLRATADEFGFEYCRVQIRRQRTRWGSCSISGTISLNVCLLFLDPAVVRYLMIHELCHTRQMNHSPQFWQLVGACEPQYRQLDRALTHSWRQVPWWMFG